MSRERLGELLKASGTRGGARLAAGGAYGLWMKTGHYEVTQDAAERFGFSSAAVSVMRDAVQDPDFYEWSRPAAHAQSPDGTDFEEGEARIAAEQAAIGAFHDWMLGNVANAREAAATSHRRAALYWIGYLLHGVQDLAAHAGRTNAEHASGGHDPDSDPDNIELARHYTFRMLRALRDVLGADSFDALRGFQGEGAFSHDVKEKRLHGHGWDLSLREWLKYEKNGRAWAAHPPAQGGVRWSRERVLGLLLEKMTTARIAGAAKRAAAKTRPSAAFETLTATASRPAKAKWTVLVYMAGDDANPDGIEYAVKQDLHEIKALGSTEDVHFIAQTDEATTENSYRYRLRRGTPLPADRLAVFRGDVNTGRASTLVEFVAWAAERYPAERYALVLWGHGSGYDDQDVYRMARGKLTPRVASELARRRLGFFVSSRRAILERAGPSRGYGFDSTASDFLDNAELRTALLAIAKNLGRPLDLLGFDACLMAMVEVAWQLRGCADVVVASELTEPGDGWRYDRAFRAIVDRPGTAADDLARHVVGAFRSQYRQVSTLSALRMDALPALGEALARLAESMTAADYFEARRRALDCSPYGNGGYRDLGTFLATLGPLGATARRALRGAVIGACGEVDDVSGRATRTSGLTIYVPEVYRPYAAGGSDEIYERLDFPATCAWAAMLRRVAASRPTSNGSSHTDDRERVSSLHALDRHNARGVLTSVLEKTGRTWVDTLRDDVLRPLRKWADHVLGLPDDPGPLRIAILPGIMGSTLSDRAGHNGLVWIDPIGLLAADDLDAMRLTPDGNADADVGTRIAAVGTLPILFDRLALSLMASHGRCVEQIGYDWRRGVSSCADDVAARLRALLEEDDARRVVVVAHSMGGLVAANAVRRMGDDAKRVLGCVALGTPWLGSPKAALALRGDAGETQTLARLTHRSRADLLGVVQTWWGLTDLLPADPTLLDPALYAPGPLPSAAFAAQQLGSPRTLDRSPAPKTTAVVSDDFETVTRLDVGGGSVVPEEGPGDGTVPLASATHAGTLPFIRVRSRHAAMPLDHDSIGAALDVVADLVQSSGRAPSKLPPFPPIDLEPGTSHGALLSRFDEPRDADLRLGEFASLVRVM